MMMIIDPNSRAHKGKKERGEVKGEYGGVCGEEEGNADYGGMMQPSQQHVAPCVKVVEWGFASAYKQKSFVPSVRKFFVESDPGIWEKLFVTYLVLKTSTLLHVFLACTQCPPTID